MSFIDGIFNFKLDLCKVESNLYETVKVHITRHQTEGLQFFYARLLAYAHAYQPELYLSADSTTNKQPHLLKKEPSGDLSFWGNIGDASAKEVRHARKASKQTRVVVYFFTTEQINNFCQQMRGSQENWIKDVEFFYLDSETLNWLALFEGTSRHWSVTLTEANEGFITIADQVNSVSFSQLDMWHQYQLQLQQKPILNKSVNT